MTESAAPLIDYQPGRPNRRRRWGRWALVSLGVGVAALAYFKGNTLVGHARVRMLTRQCLSWTEPADTVMYQCFPEAAEKLIQTQGGVYRPWGGDAAREVPAWRDLQLSIPGAPAVRPPVLFVHGRSAVGGGPVRLVVVQAASHGVYYATAIDPGGPFTRPRVIKAERVEVDRESYEQLMTAGLFRDGPSFLAGQPDASDGSHFTIGWIVVGKLECLDGWLLGGDTVRLKVRDVDGVRERMRHSIGADR